MVDSRLDENNHSTSRGRERVPVANQIPGHSLNPFGDTRFSLIERRETYTPSTVSASSSSPSSPNSLGSTRNVHQSQARTNLGMSRYYAPSQSKLQTQTQTLYSPTRPTPPPKPRREAGWNDDEMPFDQMGLSRPVNISVLPTSPPRFQSPRSNQNRQPRPMLRPFDEPSAFCEAPEDELIIVGDESSPGRGFSDGGLVGRRDVQVLRAYYSDNERFRSASPPTMLRGTHPTSPPYALSLAESDATTRFVDNSRDMEPGRLPIVPNQNEDYEEFGLSPGSNTDSSPRKMRKKTVLRKPSFPAAGADTAGDEDSLFNFEAADERKRLRAAGAVEANARSTKPRRFRRNRKSEDDNSSLEADDSLQKRTQQAYQRRNRNLYKGTNAPQRPSKAAAQRLSNIVCFDTNEDMMFNFAEEKKKATPAVEMTEVETTASGFSLNSEYTKSMESEVEDLFKDLLFIGDGKMSKPGRRSYKYKQSKKFDADSYASETLGTLEEDWTLDASNANGTSSVMNGDYTSTGDVTPSSSELLVKKAEVKAAVKSPSSVVAAEDDPFSAIWELLEGGVNLVTVALGLPPPDCSEPDVKATDQGKKEGDTEAAIYAHPGGNAFVSSKPAVAIEVKEVDKDETSPINATIATAADWLLGGSADQSKTEPKDFEFEDAAMYSLERDPGLADLAFYAAQSIHELRGLEFDESCRGESLVTQVEFKVIKIGLPLGVLFQENDGGCWVANVFETGNAAKLAPDDAIRAGDQLAAVDGRSAIAMKVDDICSLISEAENTQSIELTFLRYVGPVGPHPDDILFPVSDVETGMADRPRSPTYVKEQMLPMKEHVFDTMHKMLPISKNEEKRQSRKIGRKRASSHDNTAKFKWFGRGSKA